MNPEFLITIRLISLFFLLLSVRGFYRRSETTDFYTLIGLGIVWVIIGALSGGVLLVTFFLESQ